MEVRDVVDLDSALVSYLAEDRTAVCPPQLSDKNRLETYPTWSPDGEYLYYCSAPVLWKDRDSVPPENYEKVKYDLCRVSFDVRDNSWGPVETVLSAEETGLSILLPRISPDGRFLLFCMCEYGCFPVYQASSDLYIMDLSTGKYRSLAVNSKYSESWHSWSSNSRWIAFSSKRQDGLFTRTYLSYVSNDGEVHKPFVLPQRDPAYYDSLLETYSVPELITGKIKVRKSLLGRAARSKDSISVDIPITSATPKAGKAEPWQERE
jgi:Tol biopolymer transport system component